MQTALGIRQMRSSASSSDLARPMIYRTYIPPPPLSDFVALFWLYEGFEAPHARRTNDESS